MKMFKRELHMWWYQLLCLQLARTMEWMVIYSQTVCNGCCLLVCLFVASRHHHSKPWYHEISKMSYVRWAKFPQNNTKYVIHLKSSHIEYISSICECLEFCFHSLMSRLFLSILSYPNRLHPNQIHTPALHTTNFANTSFLLSLSPSSVSSPQLTFLQLNLRTMFFVFRPFCWWLFFALCSFGGRFHLRLTRSRL